MVDQDEDRVSVPEAKDKRTIEGALNDLKASMAKYTSGKTQPTPEVLADLTRAIHDISDHLVDLHRRVERVEESQEEWTTRGWLSPPGSDSSGSTIG